MRYRSTHFLFLQGAHDNGTLFLFLTTLYFPSGEYCPELDAEGGVGVIAGVRTNAISLKDFEVLDATPGKVRFGL